LEIERLSPGGSGQYALTTALLPGSDPLQPVSVGHNSSSFTPENVVAADFNGDGIPDLAVGDIGTGNVALFLGNGDGSVRFASQVGIYPSGTGNPTDLAVADFDGNGTMDLAVLDADNQDVAVLLGNGDGTFQAPKLLPLGGQQGILQSVSVGDFNG